MASMAVGFAHSKPSSLIPSCTSLPQKQIPTLLFPKPLRHSPNTTFSSSSSSFSLFSSLFSERWSPCCAAAESFEAESAPALVESTEVVEPDQVEESDAESAPLAEVSPQAPKGIDIFAVVMVGSRQYIVIPGRSICTQRLKGADVNDKIILSKVLLVGTKSEAYIGKPVVTNAAVHAVVEEQGLNKKVIVFKYKRRKNYRRNIGHRQCLVGDNHNVTGMTCLSPDAENSCQEFTNLLGENKNLTKILNETTVILQKKAFCIERKPNTRLRITGITGYEDYPVSTLAAA